MSNHPAPEPRLVALAREALAWMDSSVTDKPFSLCNDLRAALASQEAHPAPAGSEPDWWIKELQNLFVAPIGSPVSADMKRAANIALKVARGERWDEERHEWVAAPVAQPRPQPSELTDTARLDWLQEYDDHFHNIDRITAVQGKFNGLPSLREAIDRALAAPVAQPSPQPPEPLFGDFGAARLRHLRAMNEQSPQPSDPLAT